MKRTNHLLLLASTAGCAWAEPSAPADDAEPITLTLFIHDDVSAEQRANLKRDYLWFIDELSDTLQHRIDLVTVTDLHGYTNVDYQQGTADDAVKRWYERTLDFRERYRLPLRVESRKYILVTASSLDSTTQGIALKRNGVAIASLDSYHVIAHEVGHLFGAEHRQSTVLRPSFLPCLTTMYSPRIPVMPHCYRYSDANRAIMHRYVQGR